MSFYPITSYKLCEVDDRLTYPVVATFATSEALEQYGRESNLTFIPVYPESRWLGGYIEESTGRSFIVLCDYDC